MTQSEIADLHKDYGVFLVPTRMDAQGVSRDEAMASGLVPVTNRVAAIPEFVDDTCGILAKPEEAESLAKGILHLYNSPDKFARLSNAAAERVRKQTALSSIISQELNLFTDTESKINRTVTIRNSTAECKKKTTAKQNAEQCNHNVF